MSIKYLDDNGVLYLWNKITSGLSGKVEKENGKGLSSNDFTTAEKTKLGGIEVGAQANVNADWNAVSGNAAILNKPSIPTAVSDLTNDSGYQTSTDVTTAINQALSGITGISFEVVSSLPATGTIGKIYLISHSHGTNDSYDEYIYYNDNWEKIGNTDIDLSGYVLTTDLVSITNAEIDTITS